MDIPFNVDLPPVPICFSKLLPSESESSASEELPSQPWREAERLRELKEVMLKSLAQKSLHDTAHVNNESVTEATLVSFGDNSTDGCVNVDDRHHRHVHDGDDAEGTFLPFDQLNSLQLSTNAASPFGRLNTALGRLKREMATLRHLDMSLCCQLLSLNEAIQDFKMSINDRCSEYTGSEYTCSEYTGSEYSFGEGMGSRVGSFSSLNDENDWSHRDFRVSHDDPSSPLYSEEAGEDRTSADELAASTSSFLQQIKDLTMRVESDF